MDNRNRRGNRGTVSMTRNQHIFAIAALIMVLFVIAAEAVCKP
jgi:hypothetical protein